MVRMINKSGGTKTVLGRDIIGNQEVDVSEDNISLYLRNKFVLVSEEVESSPVVEETVEVEEASSEPSLDLESMTKERTSISLEGSWYQLQVF